MKTGKALTIAVVFALAVGVASAAEKDWEFSLAPYAWLVGISGDVGPAANPAEVDVDFTDLLSRVEWGVRGAAEARYRNRWLAIIEGSYAELEEGGNAPRGGPGGVPAPGGPLDLEMDMSLGTAFLGYRVERKTTVDILVGARWLYTKSYLKFPQTMTRRQDWVDPVVGMRVSHPLGNRWLASVEADVGGFGVGSDLVWQVVPCMSYRFTDKVAGRVAYRLLDIDYEKGEYALDVQFKGWLVGAVIDF